MIRICIGNLEYRLIEDKDLEKLKLLLKDKYDVDEDLFNKFLKELK